jgi:hypothetical protein
MYAAVHTIVQTKVVKICFNAFVGIGAVPFVVFEFKLKIYTVLVGHEGLV